MKRGAKECWGKPVDSLMAAINTTKTPCELRRVWARHAYASTSHAHHIKFRPADGWKGTNGGSSVSRLQSH